MSLFSGDKGKALVLGHSHIAALAAAYQMRCKRLRVTPRLSFIAFNEERHKPLLCGDGQLNAVLDATIAGFLASAKPKATFITVGGSTHVILGLAEHPMPFTLFPADVRNRPEVRFMSYELMKSAMASYMETDQDAIRFLAKRLPKPIYALESPPPIKDETHIRSVAAGKHLEKIACYGIASPLHRLRMWELQSEILSAAYGEAGIVLLPVPPECRDAEGFRHPKVWHVDPVHGNVLYGERVLVQIERILEDLP